MKKALVIALLAATPALAQDSVEIFCTTLGEAAQLVQEGRNAGVSASIYVRELKDPEIDSDVQELMLTIITSIYDNIPRNPEAINTIAYDACIRAYGQQT